MPMGMELFTMTADLRPEITVKDRGKENYADALVKAKNALYDKMHNMIPKTVSLRISKS